MKIEQKRYTRKSKVSTLRILEKNDFNYLKTEILTGVCRSTIKKWEASYGEEVFSGISPNELALQEVDLEMKRNDKHIIKKYYLIRRQLLDRIQELIPGEIKLEPLINALKSISVEIIDFDGMSRKEEETSCGNFFQDLLRQSIGPTVHENTPDTPPDY